MRTPARLIDANANRAAEAARTLEDAARFLLDDGPLADRFKRIRHTVRRAVHSAGWSEASLLEDRDTARDVGIQNSRADAHQRSTATDLCGAAASRLTEALRVLEETFKLTNPEIARSTEQLRYDAYDAGRRVVLALSRPASHWRVCVLVTEGLCRGGDWLGVAERSVAAGADCVQLREKSLSDRELLTRARALVDAVRPAGGAVIINDRADIAALADADGVHLGQDDLAVHDARTIVGERRLIGVSCSTVSQAVDAAEAGADMLGLGPMFPSTTKTKSRLAGPDLLEHVLAEPRTARLPHVAISGIDARGAAELARLGCRGVAVSSAVCGAEDPAAVVADILAAFTGDGSIGHEDAQTPA
ncbi:MAG: thiamine phosphate synthase [Phycisphaerales bacterium]